MNLFTFLKSNSGKIAKGPLLGGVATLAGLGLTMGGYNHDVATYDNPTRTVSSLRSIGDESLRDRLERADNGELTSMSDYLKGSGSVALGLNGDDFQGGSRGGDIESLDSHVAYQFSQGDGLSGGGQDGNTGTIGHFEGGAAGAVNPSVTSGAAGGAAGGAGGNNGGHVTTPGVLARGSVAHASGSGGGNSYAGGVGGAGGQNGNGKYNFSGSMPSSSSMDDLIALRNDPSLNGSRNSRNSRFGNTGDTRGDRLRKAAKYSQKAAARGPQLAANEGGGAFLEGGLSNGITLTDGTLVGSEGSSSDLTNNNANIDNKLDGLKDDLKDNLDKQKEARKKLRNKILLLIGMTLAAAVGMYMLIRLGQKMINKAYARIAQLGAPTAANAAEYAAEMAKIKWGKVLKVTGWALAGAVAVYAGFVVKDSINFLKDFPDAGKTFPIIGMLMAAASATTLTLVGIKAGKDAALGMDTKKTLSGQLKTLFSKESVLEKSVGIATDQLFNQIK